MFQTQLSITYISVLVLFHCLSVHPSIQEEQETRKRVAFRSEGGDGKTDDGTPLTGRATIGEDFTLTITSVQPSDELSFFCQANAGPAGVGEASTMLKVFRELAIALWPFVRRHVTF